MLKRGESGRGSTGEGLSIAFESAKKAGGRIECMNDAGMVNFHIRMQKC